MPMARSAKAGPLAKVANRREETRMLSPVGSELLENMILVFRIPESIMAASALPLVRAIALTPSAAKLRGF